MRRIALYLSGHGLGHAMRMKELLFRIRERAPSAALYVTGPVPRWVFEEPPAVPVRLRPLRCDVGAIQDDSLRLDVRRTIEENERFYRDADALVRREAAFLRAERIDLVVGDIPLAFLAASEARRPSVAVGNFSWDWIYEEYAARRASFGSVVELARGRTGGRTSCSVSRCTGRWRRSAGCGTSPSSRGRPRRPAGRCAGGSGSPTGSGER